MHLNQPIDLTACPKDSTVHGCRVGQMRVRHLFRYNALAEFADNPNEVPKVRSESNGLYERVPAGNWNLFSTLERHRESKRD